MQKELNYFCEGCEVFFSSVKKIESCPVCQHTLIPVDTWKFIQEWEQRCPITLKKIEKEDPEYLILNYEKMMFHKKKIKGDIPIMELQGSVIEKGVETLKFLTIEQYTEIRKNYGKKSYIINEDGSFQEKP